MNSFIWLAFLISFYWKLNRIEPRTYRFWQHHQVVFESFLDWQMHGLVPGCLAFFPCLKSQTACRFNNWWHMQGVEHFTVKLLRLHDYYMELTSMNMQEYETHKCAQGKLQNTLMDSKLLKLLSASPFEWTLINV
jgi:hypothetical protein